MWLMLYSRSVHGKGIDNRQDLFMEVGVWKEIVKKKLVSMRLRTKDPRECSFLTSIKCSRCLELAEDVAWFWSSVEA